MRARYTRLAKGLDRLNGQYQEVGTPGPFDGDEMELH